MFNVLADEVIELFTEVSYDNSVNQFSIKSSILLKDKSILLDVLYINKTDFNNFNENYSFENNSFENCSFNDQIFNFIIYVIEDSMKYFYCEKKIKLVCAILSNTTQRYVHTNFDIIDEDLVDVLEIHSQISLFLLNLTQLNISLRLFIEGLKVEELLSTITIENSDIFATETDLKQYVLDITLNNLLINFKYTDYLCKTLSVKFKENTHIYFENFYFNNSNLVTTNGYQILTDNKNMLNSKSNILVKAENNDNFIKLIVSYFYKNNKSTALYKMFKSNFEYNSMISLENSIYNFLSQKLKDFFPNFSDVSLVFDFTGFDFPSHNNVNNTLTISFNKNIKNKDYFKKTFGEGMRQIRLNRGETREEFGEILSYSTSMVKQLELGKKSPSFDSLIHIVQTLGVDINFF